MTACVWSRAVEEFNMQRSRMLGNWLSPLVVLLSMVSPALSQQPAPEEKKSSDTVNGTRELESEIEQYPGPDDGVMEESDTRIPEEIQPKPRKPIVAAPAADPSSPLARGSSIDPKEVQRVFGQDTMVLDLDTLNSAQVTRLQTRLRELGHYLGVIDGIVGPKTRAALSAVIADQFALSQRLLQQNQMTTELASQVGVEAPLAPSSAPPAATPPRPPSP
jgi:hypothetical protein